MKIQDGTGHGYYVKVNALNELQTRSRIETHFSEEAARGRGFSTPTDFVALTTTASFTGLLYITNTSEDLDIVITSIAMCGNMAYSEWKLIKNPTAGTLISSGAALTPVNINHKAATTFVGTARKGSDAQTVTDGTLVRQWVLAQGHHDQYMREAQRLGNGDALALVVKPSAAGDVCANIVFSQEPKEEV